MCRLRLVFAVVFCLPGVAVLAQQSPSQMFKETSHDFGPVARAAKVEHRFKFQNTSDKTIHIANVRSSCGCTMPRAEKDTIAPGEVGVIIAAFNTLGFTGQRGAQVTVSFDQPYWTEVQLQVKGYIRTDVVLHPGQVTLGSVDHGSGVEKKIAIEYAGRNDWKILDVKSPSPLLSASVVEKARGNGRVSYELIVQMDKDAPAGYLKNQLTLVTNDRRATQFPVNVEGFVVEELSVSPSTLMLGLVRPGQEVTKQIVVRGKEPFRVLSIHCENKSFTFNPSDESKTVHLIPVHFTPGATSGKFAERIVIETDMRGRIIELPTSGQVAAPLAGN
jgi:hypothetical protein